MDMNIKYRKMSPSVVKSLVSLLVCLALLKAANLLFYGSSEDGPRDQARVLRCSQPWHIFPTRAYGVDKDSPRYKLNLSIGVNQLNKYLYSREQLAAPNLAAGSLYIEDVFLAIKSTHNNHWSRIQLLLETWVPMAKTSVYILTDGDDPSLAANFGNGSRYVNTKCGASHKDKDLMCKLQVMYDLYMSKIEQYKWFCSVDDDTYINIPNFVKMLREYDHDKDWYIGKPSLNHIYSVMEHKKKKISYWFATGGAALCISRALAKRMMPLCGNGEFIKRGEAINNPDDTAIGYVCNYLLGVPLTSIPEMHSHLEPMWQIDPLDYHKQISISWGEVVASKVIIIPNRLLIRDEIPQFPVSIDPTRAYTFHCHLFPKSDSCRKIQDRLGALPDA